MAAAAIVCAPAVPEVATEEVTANGVVSGPPARSTEATPKQLPVDGVKVTRQACAAWNEIEVGAVG